MRKKLFIRIAVLFAAALLCLAGCSTPHSDNGNQAQEDAEAFTTAHAGVLGKTADTVTANDEAAVDAALAAYDALGEDAKALLGAEKTLLDSLKAKIDALKGDPAGTEAAAFKTAHAGALGKTPATVTTGDEAAVNAALAAYNALGAGAKALLGAEKALLDSLKARIDALKGDPAETEAAAFKEAHAGALGKTPAAVTTGDEAAVDAALAAYEALGDDVKALLGAEKALLDSLKAKIDELKNGGQAGVEANAFKTAHAGALGKTPATVTTGDEAAVEAALAAYNALGANAKALLGTEKTLLDSMKAKIGTLKGADAFKTAHAGALGKTPASVTTGDEAAVDAALAAHETLGDDVKALLADEKALLDSLKAKIDELKNSGKAGAEANAFKTAHAGALGKTPAAVATGDEAAVDAALAAYGALGDDVKALLGTEKALLDSLKTRIGTLKGADAFKTAHAGALGKTVDTIAAGDEAAVDAALAAYGALGDDVKALLTAEKALLDSLKTKIGTLKGAQTFKTAHAGALGKTVDTVAAADRDAVNAALAAYGALGDDVKALLAVEKTLLDSLKTKIDKLLAAADANAFKAAHAVALGKTVYTVLIADGTAVNAALAAFSALSPAAKALLTAEKTLLDSLKTKIDQLQAAADANAFKTDHAEALGMTVTAVKIADGTAVNGALAAYADLSAAAKALLTAEKTLLDSLKTKIDQLGLGRFTVSTENGILLSDVPASLVISKGSGDVFVIRAAEGLDSIRWSLNGTDIPAPRGTGREIAIEAISYIPGRYTLRLYVEQELNGDTVPYSINFTFTVTN